jgi:hypothetical protein
MGGGRIMDEYIKRQDAIDAALYKSYPGEIESALKNVPAINVVQTRCPECECKLNYFLNGGEYNYCPNCGERMK